MTRVVLGVLAIGLGSPRLSEPAEAFKLVAHPGSAAVSLTRSQAANMFLGKASRWPDGGNVVVVDQSAHSPVRAAFDRDVLGKSIDEVISYWQQVVFSGRGIPPKVKGSDADVVSFVAVTPGALAYVSAATPTETVKVVRLDP